MGGGGSAWGLAEHLVADGEQLFPFVSLVFLGFYFPLYVLKISFFLLKKKLLLL